MSRGSIKNGSVPSDISELYEHYLSSGIIRETSPCSGKYTEENTSSANRPRDYAISSLSKHSQDNSSSISSYSSSEASGSLSSSHSNTNTPPNISAMPETHQDSNWAEEGAAKIVTQSRDLQGKVVTQVTKKSILDFEMTKELGEGSYSTVYLGKDKSNGKIYALKVLDKRHIIKEKKVKYVNIEKFALNRLRSSRGVIHLYYTFQDRLSLYFVLQYAPNGELLTLIKKYGSLSLNAAQYYSAQLISVIDYMHLHGVIHRDLKPENVLIGPDMRILVTDFGTAKILDPCKPAIGGSLPVYPDRVRASSFVGTAEYVSPELLNDKWCGKEADVWSFGCIVYQMIAGKPPFKAANEYQTFQKVIKLQYAFSAGFPTVVRDLVRRILVTKPENRLTVQEVKEHYWFRDLTWDESCIWDKLPPQPLGPYKLTASAMMPIIGLDKLKATRPSVYSRRSSDGVPAGNSASYATSLGTKHATPLGIPINLQPTTFKKKAQVKYSAPLAAKVALVEARRKSSGSVGSGGSTSVQKRRARSSRPSTSASTPASILASSAPVSPPIPLASSSSSPFFLPDQAAASNMIPGTNIPRPMLHTRIVNRAHSASSIGSIGRPVSPTVASSKSFGSAHSTDLLIQHWTRDETPAMTSLDLTWVDFLQKDERVIKAGLVDVSRHLTVHFKDTFHGKIAESPLGYSSREIDGEVLHKAENSVSMKFSDRFNKQEAKYEEKKLSERGAGAKFMSLFNLKNEKNGRENTLNGSMIMKGRALVVTSFGRALLFIRHIDRKHDKFEQCAEVNLASPSVKFVEVVGAGFATSSGVVLGTFAVISNVYTLAFDVERQEISLWTRSLARGRLQQQTRLIESDAVNFERRKTAFKATALAANGNEDSYKLNRRPPPETEERQEQTLSNVGLKEETTKSFEKDDLSSRERQENSKKAERTASASSKIGFKPNKASHSRHSSSSGTTTRMLRSTMRDVNTGNSAATRQKKHTRNRSLQEQEESRILASNSPMISAAISRAVASSSNSMSTSVHPEQTSDRRKKDRQDGGGQHHWYSGR